MHKIIAREIRSFEHFNDASIGATMRQPSLWDAFIDTDIDSTYGSRRYNIEVTLPPNYPFVPMRVRFITPIKNEYITSEGYLNLDILGTQWTPTYSIAAVLLSFASILNACDIDNMRSRQVARQEQIRAELISRIYQPTIEQ